jgi:hypothetical protein
MTDEYLIEVHAPSLKTAGALANSLQDSLKQVGVPSSREKADPNTMDLGTLVTVIISSGAATALAQGVSTWLQKNLGASVSIKKNGETVIKGTNASGIALILQQLKDTRQ